MKLLGITLSIAFALVLDVVKGRNQKQNVHMVINEETVFDDNANNTDGIPPDKRTNRRRSAVLPDWTEPLVELAAGALKTKRYVEDGHRKRRTRRTIDITINNDNTTENITPAKTSQGTIDQFIGNLLQRTVLDDHEAKSRRKRSPENDSTQPQDNPTTTRKARQYGEPMFTIDNRIGQDSPHTYVIDSGKQNLGDTVRFRSRPSPGQPWFQEGGIRTPIRGTPAGQRRPPRPMSINQFYGPNTRPEQRHPPAMRIPPIYPPRPLVRPPVPPRQPPVNVYHSGPLQPNRQHVFDIPPRPGSTPLLRNPDRPNLNQNYNRGRASNFNQAERQNPNQGGKDRYGGVPNQRFFGSQRQPPQARGPSEWWSQRRSMPTAQPYAPRSLQAQVSPIVAPLHQYAPPPTPQINHDDEFLLEQLTGLANDLKAVLVGEATSPKQVRVELPKKDKVAQDGQLVLKVGRDDDGDANEEKRYNHPIQKSTRRYVPLG